MQSILSASKGSNTTSSNKTGMHHGAHHPLVAAASLSSGHQPKRLSSIQKLIVFAVVSLVILTYILFGPTKELNAGANPPQRSSTIQRPDAYSGTELPKSATSMPMSDIVKAFFAVAPPTKCPPALFSFQEISKHRAVDDLWLIINGMVLNVTRFVPSHPGGRVIVDGALEEDGAALFSQYHSPSTMSLFQNFCIGRRDDSGAVGK